MKIKKVLIFETEFEYQFNCPGCGVVHKFNTIDHSFNHDFENPTVLPSIISTGYKACNIPYHCVCFLLNGKIVFTGDCLHRLKGMSVELLPIL